MEYGLFWFSVHVLNGPDKGKEFKIPSHHITIGRDGNNNICLTDPKISTLHAKIELRRGKIIFSQLGEKNPSVIRSEMETIKLEASDKRDCLLKNGDIIMMGETQLMVRIKSTGETSKRIVTTEDVDICINFENL
jgi:pSer/pThr/pTyr-binding forkhead associated (FHA) protein